MYFTVVKLIIWFCLILSNVAAVVTLFFSSTVGDKPRKEHSRSISLPQSYNKPSIV